MMYVTGAYEKTGGLQERDWTDAQKGSVTGRIDREQIGDRGLCEGKTLWIQKRKKNRRLAG